MTEVLGLEDLIAEGTARLRAAGLPEPRREATRLWADLEGLASYTLPPTSPVVSPTSAERFRAALQRRAAGEPLPYVTGIVGFRRLTLRVDRRALIPRPETEGLVDLVLRHAPTGLVADVGTGTGCIALALADEGAYRGVMGVERSPEALRLAAENRDRTGLRIALLGGDLLHAVGPGQLDAVVSNPPYLSQTEYAALDPAVRSWEPHAALASGPEGLDATRDLLTQAAVILRPGGLVALEIDANRGAESARLAADAGLMAVSVYDDLFGRARYLLARRSERP